MLGILGGGQLGRMFTVAAKTMGYKVTVLDPDPNAPAAEFADRHLCAPFDDQAALDELAKCAAVTTELKTSMPTRCVFSPNTPMFPPSGDCRCPSRKTAFRKKAWIRKAGLQTAPYQAVCKAEDITEESVQFLPGILKTATLGYDAKAKSA